MRKETNCPGGTVQVRADLRSLSFRRTRRLCATASHTRESAGATRENLTGTDRACTKWVFAGRGLFMMARPGLTRLLTEEYAVCYKQTKHLQSAVYATMTAAQEHRDMLSCRCHYPSSDALHCSPRYRHRAIASSSISQLSRLFPPGVGWQQGGAVARLRHCQRCYLLPPYTCLTVPRFVLSLAPRSSQHRA